MTLTSNSSMYSYLDCGPTEFYYEAIEMIVNKTGYYHFSTNSTHEAYNFIYENNFDIFYVTKNLLETNYRENSLPKHGWSFSVQLYANRTYILVVTTVSPKLEETFVVRIIGVNYVTFNRIHNIPQMIESIYEFEFTHNSQIYGFTDCAWQWYMRTYVIIKLNVITSGVYTISGSCAEKNHIYLYKDSFTPSNVSINLLHTSQHGPFESKFKLLTHLDYNQTYSLVVGTSKGVIFSTDGFKISVAGLNKVTFNPISKNINYIN